MKTKTIIGIALVIVGFVLSTLTWYGPLGEGAGYIAILIAYPLIIIGILLLFSMTGAIIFSVGGIITLLSVLLQSTTTKSAVPAVDVIGGLIWMAYGLFAIGIIYGIIEGIFKIVKQLKGVIARR